MIIMWFYVRLLGIDGLYIYFLFKVRLNLIKMSTKLGNGYTSTLI